MPSRHLEGGNFESGQENSSIEAVQYNGDLASRLPDYFENNVSPEKRSCLPKLKQLFAGALALASVSMGGGRRC